MHNPLTDQTMKIEQANVVSSYSVIKGPMIEETYSVMATWDFDQSLRKNLNPTRNRALFGTKSHSWLRDAAKVLNHRFDPAGRDRALVALAKSGCELEEWKPLLLWHRTRQELLLEDFLIHWLFPTCYGGNAYHVRQDDLHAYFLSIGERGITVERAWSPTTLYRVLRALLKIACDFGLLKGGAEKQFATYRLPERSFIYLLHIMLDKYKTPSKVVHAVDWRMFLLLPSDVERELVRLHSAGKLQYEVLGGSARLSLPCKNAEEYAKRMVAVGPGDRCNAEYAEKPIEWTDPGSGEIRHAHAFVGELGFSRFTFAWASEDARGPNWILAHRKMFEAFGGAPLLTISGCLEQGTIKGHRYNPKNSPGSAEIADHDGTQSSQRFRKPKRRQLEPVRHQGSFYEPSDSFTADIPSRRSPKSTTRLHMWSIDSIVKLIRGSELHGLRDGRLRSATPSAHYHRSHLRRWNGN